MKARIVFRSHAYMSRYSSQERVHGSVTARVEFRTSDWEEFSYWGSAEERARGALGVCVQWDLRGNNTWAIDGYMPIKDAASLFALAKICQKLEQRMEAFCVEDGEFASFAEGIRRVCRSMGVTEIRAECSDTEDRVLDDTTDCTPRDLPDLCGYIQDRFRAIARKVEEKHRQESLATADA